jgi:trimethylamine--corrinoid protein Co-methyltransferase
MYLKKSYRKSTGRTYLVIAQKYRDPETGISTDRTVKSLGYLDELEKIYDDPIAHFKEVARKMTEEENAKRKLTLSINMEEKLPVDTDNRKIFGYAAILKIYHELGLDVFFKNKSRHENFEYNTNSIMMLLVISRLLSPGPYQDIVGGMLAEPNDIPHEIRHAIMMYSCIKNSDKPYMGSVMGTKGAKDSIRMAAILFDCDEKTLKEYPSLISINCSLTPLGYDDRMLGSIMEYAKARQPQLISSLAIAGSTAPATLAGTLVIQNAEILAGIVLTQLVCEGTPVIYAASSSNTEMRYGSLCIGSPENALCVTGTAQLAKYYNLPSRAGGCISDSKVPDAQSGYESMMNMLIAESSGINFVLHSAGITESFNCMSYEKFMIDNEICGIVKRIRKNIEVNEDTLALKLIETVGPGGHFLDKEHTCLHFKNEFYHPEISNRSNYNSWKIDGARHAMDVAKDKYRAILANFEPPQLSTSIDKKLQKYIEEL